MSNILKIAVCGDEKVGKTAIAKKYTENTFLDSYKMTIASDFITKDITVRNFPVKLQIWDFGGSDRFKDIRIMNYRGLRGAIIVFDLSNRQSFENLDNWFDEVKPDAIGAKYIIAGNKSDLPNHQVSDEEARNYAFNRGTEYFETSAKTGNNIDQAFEALAEKIISIAVEAPKPTVTTTEPTTVTSENVPATQVQVKVTEEPVTVSPEPIANISEPITATTEENIKLSVSETEISQPSISSIPEIPPKQKKISVLPQSQPETIEKVLKNNLDGLMILSIKSDYQALNDKLATIDKIENDNEKESAIRILKVLIKKGENKELDENTKYLIIQARISLNYLLSNYYIEISENNYAAEHFLKIARDMWLLKQPMDNIIEYFIMASTISLTYNNQLIKKFFERQDRFFNWLNEEGDIRFKLIRSLFRANKQQDHNLLNDVVELFRNNRVKFSENLQYYLEMAIDRIKSVLSRFGA